MFKACKTFFPTNWHILRYIWACKINYKQINALSINSYFKNPSPPWINTQIILFSLALLIVYSTMTMTRKWNFRNSSFESHKIAMSQPKNVTYNINFEWKHSTKESYNFARLHENKKMHKVCTRTVLGLVKINANLL